MTGTIQAGDIVLVVESARHEFLVRVTPGNRLETHLGMIEHQALVGQAWGSTVTTHLGHPVLLLEPSLDKLIRSVRRTTQIVYPKDIGYMLLKLNIGPGSVVVEAGTGSGGLTLALARMVQPHGHVYTYEARESMQAVARKNLERLGWDKYVTFKLRDIAAGFDERNVDALFLDVREPWLYLDQAHAALKGGGFFGALVPTTNQVSALLAALQKAHFGFIEVEEILLRAYKPVAERLRPQDQMVAHTGYLIFARAMVAGLSPELQTSEAPEHEEDAMP